MPPNNAAVNNAAKKARNAEKAAAEAAQKLAKNAVTTVVAENKAVVARNNASKMGVPITGGARRSASHKQALRRLNKAMTKINNACKSKKRSTRRRNH
jgi:hypothetical protein